MAKNLGQVKVALIGCGARGLGVYAPALSRFANENPGMVELTAACDTVAEKAERAAREFGFAAAVEDIAAMIRDHAPDACLCVLPPFDTMMQGSQLLAQNMPCLLELPLGESLDEIMEMSEAARESNTPHAVALNRRFNPYVVRADRWARQLGPVGSVTCSMAAGGGLDSAYLAGTVVHAVDTLAQLLGRPSSHELDVEPGATRIRLSFDDEVAGTISLSADGPDRREVYEITGAGFLAEATVEGPEGPSLRCRRGDLLEVDIAGKANEPPAAADGTYDLLNAFLGCLSRGDMPSPSIDDTMLAADLAQQITAELLQAAA